MPVKSEASKEIVDAVLTPLKGRSSFYVFEVAKELRLTQQHVVDLVREGQLGAVQAAKGKPAAIRIPISDLRRFLESRTSY